MATAAHSGSSPGLRRHAIGLREVLFQSNTDMAPGAAIAASSRGMVHLDLEPATEPALAASTGSFSMTLSSRGSDLW